MKYDKLLKLKSEVENTELSYNFLKEKLENIKERLYVDYYIKDDTKNWEIDSYLNDELEKLKDTAFHDHIIYVIKCVCYHFLIDILIAILSSFINITPLAFMSIIGGNFMLFVVMIRTHDWRLRNKCEKEITIKKEDINKLINEKSVIEKKIELTKEKYANLSAGYKKIVKKLNSKEYREYLEYVNSYLFHIVNNDKNDVITNPQLTNSDDYTLHLK